MNFNFGRGVLGRFIFAGKIGGKTNETPKGETKSITLGNIQLLPMLMMEQELHFLAVAVRRIL